MQWTTKPSTLSGTIAIPASKSHTIRALLIATLSDATSTIKQALLTGDGHSALQAALALGAQIQNLDGDITIVGCGKSPKVASEVFMGNSGTGTRLFATAAALGTTPITFDGDNSLCSRPMLPLLQAIKTLGGHYTCHKVEGNLPFTITGPIDGTTITLDGTTSQYLSSVLLTAPLLNHPTTITVTNLNERPYVEMTLWWLDKMNINYSVDWESGVFIVEGGQEYTGINEAIASDFSSATFGAVAGAMSQEGITLTGLDFSDPQGDKGVFDLIEQMGAMVSHTDAGVTIKKGVLKGITMDPNRMPDSLPALCVLATQASTPTTIVNVAQARIKETDRISVMATELAKMGAKVEEHPDGMTIYPAQLIGATVNGHDDHRIVMALTLAGFVATGDTTITTSEAAAVTYPTFREDFISLGGVIS